MLTLKVGREAGFGHDRGSIQEALFTWDGKNQTGSTGYEITQAKEDEGAMIKTTNLSLLLWTGYQNITPIQRLTIDNDNNYLKVLESLNHIHIEIIFSSATALCY